MSLIANLAAAAGLAALAVTALPAAADAQSRSQHAQSRDWYDYGRHNRWTGPEGYFIVAARACPALRNDGRHGRYGRHQDRRVLNCPQQAWHYVPSRREARAGHHGQRLHPDLAYWDPRSNRYYARTRWGAVPVHVEYGQAYGYRGYGHDRRGYRSRSGLHFEFRF